MRFLFFFYLFAITLPVSAKIPDLQQVDRSENLSQLLRANNLHYWAWAKERSSQMQPAHDLLTEGFLVGDAHPENFNVLPVGPSPQQLKFVLSDLDDIGQGPFAFDFLRFVAAVKAINDNVSVKELLEAYVAGVQNCRAMNPMPVPEQVEEALSLGMDGYEQKLRNKIDHYRRGDSQLSPAEVDPLPGWTSADFAGLDIVQPILDFGQRPHDHGGSADALRIWILSGISSAPVLTELKEWPGTSLSNWRTQKQIQDLFISAQQTFFAPKDEIISLVGLRSRSFWMRPKRLSLVEVPTKMPITEFQNLVLYEAAFLGQLHGGQAAAGPWAAYLATPSSLEEYREILKDLSQEYLSILEAALRK